MTDAQIRVRVGDGDDFIASMRVLEGALLDVDAGRVREALVSADDRRELLVAEADGRVVGVLFLDGTQVDAVAVTAERREQGVGTALVEAAGERRDELVVKFRAEVRGFYESLGFDVERIDSERYRGLRPKER